MDFNRFTEKLQEAVRAAQSIAVQHGNQQIDTEHLMLALLDQEGGLAPSILNKADIRVDALRTRFQQEVDRMPKVSGTGRRSRSGLRHQPHHQAAIAGRRRSQAPEGRLRLGRACAPGRHRRLRRHRQAVPRIRHHARAPDAGARKKSAAASASPPKIPKPPTKRWKNTAAISRSSPRRASWIR